MQYDAKRWSQEKILQRSWAWECSVRRPVGRGRRPSSGRRRPTSRRTSPGLLTSPSGALVAPPWVLAPPGPRLADWLPAICRCRRPARTRRRSRLEGNRRRRWRRRRRRRRGDEGSSDCRRLYTHNAHAHTGCHARMGAIFCHYAAKNVAYSHDQLEFRCHVTTLAKEQEIGCSDHTVRGRAGVVLSNHDICSRLICRPRRRLPALALLRGFRRFSRWIISNKRNINQQIQGTATAVSEKLLEWFPTVSSPRHREILWPALPSFCQARQNRSAFNQNRHSISVVRTRRGQGFAGFRAQFTLTQIYCDNKRRKRRSNWEDMQLPATHVPGPNSLSLRTTDRQVGGDATATVMTGSKQRTQYAVFYLLCSYFRAARAGRLNTRERKTRN